MENKTKVQSGANAPNLVGMPQMVLKAYRYHLKQLTAKEIAMLVGATIRTVQRWENPISF